jgi:hypothetical protein
MTTTTANERGTDATVDFGAVARVLADAAVMVRTRTERGTAAGDRRPRIGEAIARATPRGAARTTHEWAVRLAAMEIDAALGRGRHRARGDLTDSTHALAGFGLDVGTLGAVDRAADLLDEAARTATGISDAAAVAVHGYGRVTATDLGTLRADAVEVDDIVAVLHGVAASTGHGPINFRVTGVHVDAAGVRTFALDMAARPLALHGDQVTADTGWCRNVWRPVPHLPHPWQVNPPTERHHQHDTGSCR